jgi:ABC-type sugar transport system permease subunit
MRNFIEKSAGYWAGARLRAQRRKSPWNLVLIPLCGGPAIAIWYLLFRLVWWFHAMLYPGHQLPDFWRKGISFASFVPSFLMVFPLLPGALGTGLIFGNALAWLLPRVRRVFEAEAGDYPETSFRESMRRLFLLTLVSLPIGLLIALAAACFLRSLK